MVNSVKLSQCIIVKNEENNIRRALEWGKGVVFEQIVVDTGSDDRTVDIAKEMGARVFFFEWKDDFSAAKNFAIDQAKGDWIVFLDADEYYMLECAAKIIPALIQIENGVYEVEKPCAVRSALVNLDDQGRAISTGVQDRIFRNISALRYHNRIHESLFRVDSGNLLVVDASKELIIYHTGYTKQIYEETEKLGRNIRILKCELKEQPENYNAWSYLGDTLFALGLFDEAEQAYLRVISNGNKVSSEGRKEAAFSNYFKLKYLSDSGSEEELINLYEIGKAHGCESPDLEYWFGYWYYKKENKRCAVHYLEKALNMADHYNGSSFLDIAGGLLEVYEMLFCSYREFGMTSQMLRYGVLALRIDLYLMPILQEIIYLFKKENGEIVDGSLTFVFLQNLYDLSSLKNKMFLYKASQMAEFNALENRIHGLFSQEEKKIIGDIY